MDIQQICEDLLKDLYVNHVTKPMPAQLYLDEWGKSKGLSSDDVWDIYKEYLERHGLASEFTTVEIQLTPLGILEVEGRGIAPRQLITKEEVIRQKILVALNDIRNEKGDALVDWTEIVARAGISENEFERNHDVLEHQGLIRNRTIRCWEITLRGTQHLKKTV
jgi:hypothetical protein